MSVEVDHVIVAAVDIDEAAHSLYDEHGLASVAGGHHAGHGTANRIVPLGPNYIEIMGIVDEDEAAASPLGRWLRSQTAAGDRLAGLCLRTSDVSLIAQRLKSQVAEMSRLRPDGVELRWRLTAVQEALDEPPLPFFITWDIPAAEFPGRAKAEHEVDPVGITRVEIGVDEARLHSWVGAVLPELRASAGEPRIHRVVIETTSGKLVLRSPASRGEGGI